jgi:antagonist of KipI
MLEVIEAGLLTTVQGAGRPAAAPLGVPNGGACDRWSLALANALLGNQPEAPALEMTLAGPRLRALRDCTIAIAGADMEAHLGDGRAVPSPSVVRLGAGAEIAFATAAEGSGIRAYLALPGGIDVPVVLGSASTCLVGGFGGLDGRPLRAGDVIGGRSLEPALSGSWDGPCSPAGSRLRVVRGPHSDAFGGSSLDGLAGRRLMVSGQGSRQGIRLEGASIAATHRRAMVSQPMRWGAVQMPPDGQPIILLADHQTVGGYPVPAVVIGADLPTLGQLGPGDDVELVEVSLEDARALLMEHRREMAEMAEMAGRFGGVGGR